MKLRPIALLCFLSIFLFSKIQAQGSGAGMIGILSVSAILSSSVSDIASVKKSIRRYELKMLGDPYFAAINANYDFESRKARRINAIANLSPLIIGSSIMIIGGKTNDRLGIAGLGIAGLGAIISPAAGHWYAKNPKKAWKGILIRSISFAVVMSSFGVLTNLPED